MAGSDLDIVLKKEAKTSLQKFKDQTLLRRKFGDARRSKLKAPGSSNSGLRAASTR